MARASTVLPVPLSPSIRMVAGDAAALSATSIVFCTADTEFMGLHRKIKDLLEDPHLPAVQRRLLMDTQRAMGGELLPAVQKMDSVLHTKARDFCPSDPIP